MNFYYSESNIDWENGNGFCKIHSFSSKTLKDMHFVKELKFKRLNNRFSVRLNGGKTLQKLFTIER